MILDKIITSKRIEVARRKSETPLECFSGSLVPSKRDFLHALTKNQSTCFILECKRASPSKGVIRSDYDPAAIARSYGGIADAISVLTDGPFFGGTREHIEMVSRVVAVPVLCKDFIIDPYQVHEARMFGADAVLLMLSVLDDDGFRMCLEAATHLKMNVLAEVRDVVEISRALRLGAKIIGINNRDLRSLAVRLETTEELAPRIPKGITLVSESGIRVHQDVIRMRRHVDCFLVGSSMMESDDVARAARELVYGRVKVCGLTRPEDALDAWDAGAVWGGVIFADGSPRKVSREQALEICSSAPLQWAGVFVNGNPVDVAETAHELGLSAVQLHGDETPEYVADLKKMLPGGCAIWKAVRVRDSIPLPEETGADRLLLDSYEKGKPGGTGKRFDWELLKGYSKTSKIILSGGIGPSNVRDAEAQGAWAMDVNSSVESKPGVKSRSALDKFFGILRGRKRSV